jgi:threonine/homoserine/homoserine lactone efflux protein
VLGVAFVLLADVFDSGYAMAGGSLRGLLRRSPRAWSAQRWVVGGVYVGLGLVTAATGYRVQSPRSAS